MAGSGTCVTLGGGFWTVDPVSATAGIPSSIVQNFSVRRSQVMGSANAGVNAANVPLVAAAQAKTRPAVF